MSLLVQKEWNLSSFEKQQLSSHTGPPESWPIFFHILEIILGNYIAVELRKRQKW